MVEFRMALKLSPRDSELVQGIFEPIKEALILSQDYWSWDKEYRRWKQNGTRLMNAIDIFSSIDGSSIDEAKEKGKDRIIGLEKKYIERKLDFFKSHPEDSGRLRSWVEAGGAVLGSYQYWATRSIRYHDALQGSCPETGVPSDTAGTNNKSDIHTGDARKSAVDGCMISAQAVSSRNETETSVLVTQERNSSNNKSPHDDNDLGQSIQVHKKGETDLMWQKPPAKAIMAPCDYVNKLPSKGVRQMLTEALNAWLQAPKTSMKRIEGIVSTLHNSPIIIDDIQDSSSMRRGQPATHVIFRTPQAMNSGLFMYVQALQDARKLKNSGAIDIALEEIEHLYLGQSLELYWRHNLQCPSEEEYLNMVDNNTGGMFRLLLRLLQAESPRSSKFDFELLTVLLGRFSQIRDDYMNLQSTESSDQKGSCEDLDEGKYSYPILHLSAHESDWQGHINEIFKQRPSVIGETSKLSTETKVHILQLLVTSGELKFVLGLLERLEDAITIKEKERRKKEYDDITEWMIEANYLAGRRR